MKKISSIKSKEFVICAKKEFSTDGDNKKYKIKDHCHYTGK